jgi:hypothetical protein
LRRDEKGWPGGKPGHFMTRIHGADEDYVLAAGQAPFVKPWQGSAPGATPSFRFPQKEEHNFGIAISGYFF